MIETVRLKNEMKGDKKSREREDDEEEGCRNRIPDVESY